jgi:hypothetical protein
MERTVQGKSRGKTRMGLSLEELQQSGSDEISTRSIELDLGG